MSEITLYLADEDAMIAFGARLAQVTQGVGVIFLEGDLGRGKPRCPGASSVAWDMPVQ